MTPISELTAERIVKEIFVNYETANTLKEIGYDKKDMDFYNRLSETPEKILLSGSIIFSFYPEGAPHFVYAPSHTDAVNWLKETYAVRIVQVSYDKKWYTYSFIENGTPMMTHIDTRKFIEGEAIDSLSESIIATCKYIKENNITPNYQIKVGR